MAFLGKLYSVSFENYRALSLMGVDIVLVEKEGTVEKLVPFTTELGIAFVQSEGFISEYGVMLAREAKLRQVNLAILTDFDASGINLAYNIDDVVRIGVDLKTIEEFNEQRDENGELFEQLDPLELAESYNGADHWKWCDTLSKGAFRNKKNNKLYYCEETQHNRDYIDLLNTKYTFTDGRTMTYLDFLEDRRIELNTIMNEVQPQRFWNWLKDKLLETFPKRDYNRAIDIPDYVLTNTMSNFITKLKESLTSKLENNVNNIQRAYRNTNNGFLDMAESLAYTRQYLKNKLENDEDIRNIDLDLQVIIDRMERLDT